MNTSSPTASPRRWRLQFSLRLAFLALTAFAIGFPIWYRWPYVEVVEQKSPTGAIVATRRTTWQRQWGGERVRNGPDTVIYRDFTQLTNYVRGNAHGPYVTTLKGKPQVTGQYVDGMREGVWTHCGQGSTHTVSWRHDKLDGPYTCESVNGQSFRMVFAAGRLQDVNGQPARNRLLDLLESGVLDEETSADANDAQVGRALLQPTTMEFVEQPLKDVAIYLTEQHQVPIALDHKLVAQADMPITTHHEGIDLCSALALLTAQYDLGCDYRYGIVCITTAKDAEDWHDPTGVAEIQPAKNSALARAWNEPATLAAIKLPLAPLLAAIAQPLAIRIDTSRIYPTPDHPNEFPITANAAGLPFRHVLGLALYKTNCRCRLDGENLIILPPEDQ